MSAQPAEKPSSPPLPSAYLERMQRLLGGEFEAFLQSYQQPPSTGLRVNTLKISPQAFQANFPYPLSPIPWCPSGFFLKETPTSPGKHPYHAAGLYYLQDPSAMIVAELLRPQAGELVLDIAAAPGGKSTHLASWMGGDGVLVANETHPQRVWELAENLERWGARNTVILNETPARLAQSFGDIFDKVLLDAPCSGEGMFRKNEMSRLEWSPQRVASCALRQSAILRETAGLVRPGGTLVYATCTFAPEENEAVIAMFLKENPHFELVPALPLPNVAPGQPKWANFDARKKFEDTYTAALKGAVRLWPHHGAGEGHFIAMLRRTDQTIRYKKKPWQPPAPSAEAARLFGEFCSDHLQWNFETGSLVQIGSYLYQIPQGLPKLGHLKTIHPGLWLGTVKTGRFEPSHALALALPVEQAQKVIALDFDEANTYLRGETQKISGADGWALMTLDGFPLGWGKRVKGIVKNFYPKGLRWR